MTISYDVGTVPQWTVADRMRKAREFAGMEQTELAERTGLSRAGIGKAERGESIPRRSTLNLWALATGVPVEWIATGNVSSPSPEGEGLSARPEGFEPPTF